MISVSDSRERSDTYCLSHLVRDVVVEGGDGRGAAARAALPAGRHAGAAGAGAGAGPGAPAGASLGHAHTHIHKPSLVHRNHLPIPIVCVKSTD